MPKDNRIVISFSNFPDFCDRDNLFIKTFSFTHAYTGVRHSFSTRAFSVWNKMNSRCIVGGSYQTEKPSIIGASNRFESFQAFADWCQMQVGYTLKDSEHRYWALDKDILVGCGNKVYSADTCCFVPQYLNKVLSSSESIRGEFPLGVSLLKNTGKFMSYCKTSGNGKREIFGYFSCPFEAHSHWQTGKIKAILNAISRYKQEQQFNPLVILALHCRIDKLKEDITLNQETFRL